MCINFFYSPSKAGCGSCCSDSSEVHDPTSQKVYSSAVGGSKESEQRPNSAALWVTYSVCTLCISICYFDCVNLVLTNCQLLCVLTIPMTVLSVFLLDTLSCL